MYRCCEKVLTGAELWSEVALRRKKGRKLRTSHISLGDQTGTGPGNASGPFRLQVGARTRMTVTVVSAASDGSEVNESRVGDTGRKCPDGWGKRDGFFYYFERRRHLVVGVRGKRSRESWLLVVNSGTIRRMSIMRIHSAPVEFILPTTRYSTVQCPSYPSQTRSAMRPGSPSQDFSSRRVP